MTTETDDNVVDQDSANVALMLDQEIDKRVAMTIVRILTGGDPTYIEQMEESLSEPDATPSLYVLTNVLQRMFARGLQYGAEDSEFNRQIDMRIQRHVDRALTDFFNHALKDRLVESQVEDPIQGYSTQPTMIAKGSILRGNAHTQLTAAKAKHDQIRKTYEEYIDDRINK